MEILSISIDKEALRQIERVQKRLGFKSRSKMLRNAVLSMLKDYEALESLRGNVESVFILTYSESEKNHVSDLLHRFEDSIKTEMHQHNSGTCVDILNTNASAVKTRELFGVLKKNKCIYSVTYTLVKGTK
ncbi:MAG TPA: ribbon-helix-helix protein, CopG family [Candidatus Aquilonibacter sp.]|nr:ribbon-helix-helix protein, CopG family [Candidatus Aquilonibacter sp.]